MFCADQAAPTLQSLQSGPRAFQTRRCAEIGSGLGAVVDQRSACDRSQKMNGCLGRSTFQAVNFNGTIDDRIPASVADGRFRTAASRRFTALPQGGSEPNSTDAAQCQNCGEARRADFALEMDRTEPTLKGPAAEIMFRSAGRFATQFGVSSVCSMPTFNDPQKLIRTTALFVSLVGALAFETVPRPEQSLLRIAARTAGVRFGQTGTVGQTWFHRALAGKLGAH